jgi:hypothetical protein
MSATKAGGTAKRLVIVAATRHRAFEQQFAGLEVEQIGIPGGASRNYGC